MIYHITFGYHLNPGMKIYSYYKQYFPDMPLEEFAKLVGKTIQFDDTVAERVHSSKNDSFIFILTKTVYDKLDSQTAEVLARNTTMLEQYDKWLDEKGLRELEVLRTEKGITNPGHPEKPRNLVLTVLQSKDHFQRKEH